MASQEWRPDSWKHFPIRQQPTYDDLDHLNRTLETIHYHPPLVSVGEVEALKAHIAQAARGQAFVLQGGNCAERFIDCNEVVIASKFKIMLQMSVILTYAVRKPVIRIGRIAGQYWKPRSSDWETCGGQRLATYRGDAINSIEPDPEKRRPDPDRLLSAYFHAASTLNYIRSLIDGGFADLHHPYHWNMHSMEQSHSWPAYQRVVDRILDAIEFMESFGGVRSDVLGRVSFCSSHEGLVLGYEQALTRKDESSGRYYNLGAHMLWIGARTRHPAEAHAEYFRGLANPIGVKIDGKTTPDDLLELIRVLDPDNEPGKLTCITRMGVQGVDTHLPPLIEAVQKSGRVVAWSCDPMHGNTMTVNGSVKTRDFSIIQEELRRTFVIHQRLGSHLAGVHFELTADDVTECVGGAQALTSKDLDRRYETYCDPRLNYSQSLEMAFQIAHLLEQASRERP